MSSGIPDLVPIWTAIIALSVFLYVLLDGFDLGIGILYGFAPAVDRPALMNAIAPTWDGNETWLVLVGLALLAVFPLAFAIIVPAVYFPVLVMLLAMVFRGVAFEFRFEHQWLTRLWAKGFCAGSAVATFAQGALLGAFIQGFTVQDRSFAGTLLGLADTVLRADRAGADGGLWPAGRRVAGDQDRGRAASLGTPGRAGLPDLRAGRDPGNQHLDAAAGSDDRRALVRLAKPVAVGTGANRYGVAGHGGVACSGRLGQ